MHGDLEESIGALSSFPKTVVYAGTAGTIPQAFTASVKSTQLTDTSAPVTPDTNSRRGR